MKNISCLSLILFFGCTTAMAMEQVELTIIEKTVQPQQEIKTTNTIISPTISKKKYDARCQQAYRIEAAWEKAKKSKLLVKMCDGNAIQELTTSLKNPNAKQNDPREKYLLAKYKGEVLALGCAMLFCCPCMTYLAMAAEADNLS